jgi:hypothetical protein
VTSDDSATESATHVDGPERTGRAFELLAQTRQEAVAAGVVIAGSCAFGLVLGAAWYWVAPRAVAVVRAEGVFIDPSTSNAFIGADGRFAVGGLLAGALSGLLAFVILRRRPIGVLVGLAVGGVLGGLVAWAVGHWLGPAAVADQPRVAVVGAELSTPLTLRATGVLVMWPLAAVIVGFALLAGSRRRPA